MVGPLGRALSPHHHNRTHEHRRDLGHGPWDTGAEGLHQQSSERKYENDAHFDAGWSGTDLAMAKWFELSGLQVWPGHSIQLQVIQAGRIASIQTQGASLACDCFVYYGLDDVSPRAPKRLDVPDGKAWRLSPTWTPGSMVDARIEVPERASIEGEVGRTLTL